MTTETEDTDLYSQVRDGLREALEQAGADDAEPEVEAAADDAQPEEIEAAAEDEAAVESDDTQEGETEPAQVTNELDWLPSDARAAFASVPKETQDAIRSAYQGLSNKHAELGRK